MRRKRRRDVGWQFRQSIQVQTARMCRQLDGGRGIEARDGVQRQAVAMNAEAASGRRGQGGEGGQGDITVEAGQDGGDVGSKVGHLFQIERVRRSRDDPSRVGCGKSHLRSRRVLLHRRRSRLGLTNWLGVPYSGDPWIEP
jgi:hypothetical protein